jgi:EAL domain-containing protein (putative c-di-GMP-specific phosphodiesterase class I)
MLEITEGLLLNKLDESVTKRISICKRGIRFSIDDFGTDYSARKFCSQSLQACTKYLAVNPIRDCC